jgi:transketolase
MLMLQSMRDAFLDEIYNIARKDRRVILISNDFGAPSLDKFRVDCAKQFIHIGIAEQNMVNVATGLALGGKIVYMYSIAPFLPLRCYEQLRVHLAFKKYHITAVGVGAGYSYELSGPTHHTLEDIALMNVLPNMTILSPSDSNMGSAFARMTYSEPGPYYVRFDREKLPALYDGEKADFSEGLAVLKEGRDLMFVATGIMTHHALNIIKRLAEHNIDAGIIDLYRIKPIDEKLFIKYLGKSKHLVTIEENFLEGGIGSIVSGIITDHGLDTRLKRFGIPDKYFSQGGSREGMQRLAGLDVETITKNTLKWLGK